MWRKVVFNLGVVLAFLASLYVLFGTQLEEQLLAGFTPTLNTTKIQAAQLKAQANGEAGRSTEAPAGVVIEGEAVRVVEDTDRLIR